MIALIVSHVDSMIARPVCDYMTPISDKSPACRGVLGLLADANDVCITVTAAFVFGDQGEH